VIEKTLSQQFEARGSKVECGRKAVTTKPDDEGVTVLVTTSEEEDVPSGTVERMRCRYLVGANGNKRTVRKSLGLDFEAEKYTGRAIRQGDAKLRWQRSTDPNQRWLLLTTTALPVSWPCGATTTACFFPEDDRLIGALARPHH
jgi:3-(3-hydroxy-phenyl)propionate hydroxylase